MTAYRYPSDQPFRCATSQYHHLVIIRRNYHLSPYSPYGRIVDRSARLFMLDSRSRYLLHSSSGDGISYSGLLHKGQRLWQHLLRRDWISRPARNYWYHVYRGHTLPEYMITFHEGPPLRFRGEGLVLTLCRRSLAVSVHMHLLMGILHGKALLWGSYLQEGNHPPRVCFGIKSE